MSGDYPVCQVCLGWVLAQPVVLKSSMSTPTAAPAKGSQTFTSTPSAPLASGSNSNNNGTRDESGQRGANYFFGFVFMFTVILLVIVGCGIGSRRRYFSSRRVSDHNALDPWSSGSKGDVAPPRLYDIEAKSNFVDPWTNILPLSATYLGKGRLEDELNEKSEKVDDRSSSSTRTTSRTPSRFLLFPSNRRRTRSHHSAASPSSLSPETPDAVRMAVLIVMPVPHDQSDGDGHHHQDVKGGSSSGSNISKKKDLPEVQIGVEMLLLRKS